MPTVPVKLLKLRTESNLGAEGRGFESLRPTSRIITGRSPTTLQNPLERTEAIVCVLPNLLAIVALPYTFMGVATYP